jgi:hypothetical protein
MKVVSVADAPAEWIKKFILAGVQISPKGEFEVNSEGDKLPSIASAEPLIKKSDAKPAGAFCLIYYGGSGFICYVQ